jgi:mono/diheme cytochrome c family protein
MPALRRLATVFVLAALLAGVGPTPVRSDEAIPFARVAPIIQKHCQGCHGPAKTKGDLRFDKLDPDMVKGSDGDRWREVLDRLNVGDMPPDTEPALKKEERELLTNWLVQERRRAALAKNPAAHFRRLTRREYERTMQDLLGLPIDFGNRLPEDGKSKSGFRNDGDALRMSPLQYETYLQIADEALSAAIVSGPPPAVHRFRLSGFENRDTFEVATLPKPAERPGETFEYAATKGKAFRIFNSSQPQNLKSWTGTLPPSAIRRHGEAATQLPEYRIAVGLQYAYRTGETRIRVRAARVEPPFGADATRVPVLTVALGSTNFHGVELTPIGESHTINHADFRTYEFKVRMENISQPNLGPLTDKNAAILSVWNSAKAIRGESLPPRLKVEWIEFENPYFETWPPATHANILFPQKDLAEPAYAREVIRRFATRAYRGPVTTAELDRLVKLWEIARKETDTLEDSLKETLAVVLSSPRFLALPTSRSTGAKERLTDHELASRLSYFLWSTMPDAELMRLADESKLRDPTVRSAQITRLVKDAKAWQFVEQFPDQWLELDRLQRVVVNKERYPGIDDALLAAMRLETVHFFGAVLHENLSIFEFLASDFTCLNDRLAAHYGIAGVEGATFRKVKLDKDHHRGGLLTHASVLTGNSDGIDGHPIKRGMWLLKNLLDDPPPPPPPNVPELNRESPKLRGLTIPQALAAHRDNTACAGCHRKIDPWGLAFEEYDAVGNWQRDGVGAQLRKRRTNNAVDAKVELPGGAKVDGLSGLRDELIRSRADDFRRAMLRKVMAYALGRSLTLRDTEATDALVPTLRERSDKFIALIELIVGSEPFQLK